jgi:hypothetical protein
MQSHDDPLGAPAGWTRAGHVQRPAGNRELEPRDERVVSWPAHRLDVAQNGEPEHNASAKAHNVARDTARHQLADEDRERT